MERPRGLIPARLQSPDAENRTSGGVGALAGATSRQGDPIFQREEVLNRHAPRPQIRWRHIGFDAPKLCPSEGRRRSFQWREVDEALDEPCPRTVISGFGNTSGWVSR